MLSLQQRINAFAELGLIMKDAASPTPTSTEALRLRKLIDSQEQYNKWFTPDNVKRSVEAIADMLRKDRLETWLEQYKIADEPGHKKNIAVIMAGNIPLVGFHDFLCVLITGNRLLARTSTKDSELIRELAGLLTEIDNGFREQIKFTDKISGNYDAVIATGSDNTSRYFEYYFGQKPHIFRKNRNSVAIISKDTDERDIEALASDIFTYFGLGCRNVSKIFIEKDIKPGDIIRYWQKWSDIIKHTPYANNYLYNKSLLNINKQEYHDTGYSLLVINKGISSPVSVIYYDYFSNIKLLMDELRIQAGSIQCIVSEKNTMYGQTQYPKPGDYADNMDTVEFLTSLQ